jgi:hypothetical protein
MSIGKSIGKAIATARATCAKRTPPNEAATCQWVILPLLKAAGYDDADIFPAASDGAGQFPDYTLLPDEPQTFYLEAKKWELELQDNHATQATNYANTNGKRWVVLTNGRQWRLYDNHIPKATPEKLVAVADMDDPAALERFLLAIGKESVLAERLADFAAAETAALEQRRREQSEKERAQRIRVAFDDVWAAQCQTPDSALIKAMHSLLCTQEGLQEIKPEDLVAYLAGADKATPSKPSRADSPPEKGGVIEVIADVLRRRGLLRILGQDKTRIWFLPSSLLVNFPARANAADGIWTNLSPRPGVCCSMRVYKGRLAISFTCCRMVDKGLRLRLVSALEENGFSFRTKKAHRQDATWSRFWRKGYTKSVDVKGHSDSIVRDKVEGLLDERKDGFRLLEAVCRKVFR